jgi:hypothetical protein
MVKIGKSLEPHHPRQRNIMPQENGFSDKRAGRRVLTRIPLRYREIADEKEADTIFKHNLSTKISHSVDVSLTGMCIATEETLKVGSFLRLHIYLIPRFYFISATANVVWANPVRAGIHFSPLKDNETKALIEYLGKIDPGMKDDDKR